MWERALGFRDQLRISMAIAFGQIESIKAFLWWQRRDSQVAKSDRPNCFCSDCGSSWLGGVVMCRLNQISQKLR
jgi:hypothetical protein